MLLFLGRKVPLSFVHRFTTCCPPSLSGPALVSSLLIKLRSIASIAHSTVFISAAGQNTRTMPERRPFVRLPTDVYPVNYGLCLKPDLIDFTFEGKLEALVEVCLFTYTDGLVCAWRGSCYVIYPANVPANVLCSTDNGKLLAASAVASTSLAGVSC